MGGAARPFYEVREPAYRYGEEHDLDIYLAFMKSQVKELLTQYSAAAGICLDGLSVPMSGDYRKFKCEELYAVVKEASPHALISYKQGLLGTEDFFAPEHKVPKLCDAGADDIQHTKKRVGKIEEQQGKLIEVCTTMLKNPVSWGYRSGSEHLTEDEVYGKWLQARDGNYNLLLNIGVMADGQLDPIDVQTLLQVGERISNEIPGIARFRM